MHSSIIYKDKIMLLMPVVSTNFKPINNRQNFCATPYVIGTEAEKVIRKLVEKPEFATRGLLTSLSDFLNSDGYQAMTKGFTTCCINSITVPKPSRVFPVGNIQLLFNDSMTINCQMTSGNGIVSSVVRHIGKDPDVHFVEAQLFAQSDKHAAEKLLKNVAVCK